MPDRSDVLVVEQPFDGEVIEELTAVSEENYEYLRRCGSAWSESKKPREISDG